MGTSTEVALFKSKRTRVSTKLLIDVPLLLVVIILLIGGLLMLYSASWNFSLQTRGTSTYILLRQVIWVVLGTIIATVLTFMDYHFFKQTATLLLGGTCILLLVVLFIPSSIQGATRTVVGGSIQPSELAKIALIIYLAYWLSEKQESLSTLYWGFVPVIVIIGLISGLILAQPDVSATITVIFLGGIMFFVAGGNVKHIGIIVLLAVFMIFCGYFLFDKVSTRINDFFNGLSDPNLASYHIQRSIEAILRGGWTGVGIGKGVVKLTGLPVAWTDSIYAVILEETGLIGGSLVIILYTIFLWRGFAISVNAPDTFGKLLAAGITLWISTEASINIGVMLNIIPFAGNALPLISFGGSNMICTMVGIGILMSISRCSAIEALKKERTTPDAFISLRRRDWGWRISSLGRNSRKK